MTQPVPVLETMPRFGLVLPTRPDRVQIGLIDDAFRVLDTNAANLTIDNTFAANITVQGTLRAATLTVDGSATMANLTVGQDLSVGRNLTVGGAAIVTGAVSAGGDVTAGLALRASNGHLWLGGSWMRTTNGYHETSGSLQANGNLTATASLSVGANASVPGQANIGRLVVGAYDAGWPLNVAGDAIASGYFYQRANGAARCWDTLDFTFTTANVGNTLVQRDAAGGITGGGGAFAGSVSVGGNLTAGGDISTGRVVTCGWLAASGIGIDPNSAYGITLPDWGEPRGRGIANQWVTWSSRRWKRDIQPICDAVQTVLNPDVHGVRYVHASDGQSSVGFIAEDWQPILPEAIGLDADGQAVGMDYSRVVPVVFEALKEALRRIEALEALQGASA